MTRRTDGHACTTNARLQMATPLIGIGGLILIVKKMTEDPADDFMSPKAKKAQQSTGVSLDDVAGIDPIRGEARIEPLF